MSGPTPFSQDGLPLFTEERPAVVILGDLLDYIQEMRKLYDDTQELYKVLQDNLSFIGSGSPKGVYASLSALQTAKPTGDTFIYVTTDNGNWYYWNGTTWVSGGVYQATGIEESMKREILAAVISESKLIWKNPVNTFSNLTGTYPLPEIGWTVMVRDTGKIYRWNNSLWLEIQDIDPTVINFVDTKFSNKLNTPVINLAEKGAVWGQDATQAMLDAYNDLPSTGGVIQVGGNITLSQDIVFNKRIILQGFGYDRVVADKGTTIKLLGCEVRFNVDQSGVKDLNFDGGSSKTGKGLKIANGGIKLENVLSCNMQGHGIVIGDEVTKVNANGVTLFDVRSRFNNGDGIKIISKNGEAPDTNAFLILKVVCSNNGGNGMTINNSIDNNLYGLICEENHGYGVKLENNSMGMYFYSPYLEANDLGEFYADNTCIRNVVFGHRKDAVMGHFVFESEDNWIMGRDSALGLFPVMNKMATRKFVISNPEPKSVPLQNGYWEATMNKTTRILTFALRNAVESSIEFISGLKLSGLLQLASQGIRFNTGKAIRDIYYTSDSNTASVTIPANGYVKTEKVVTGVLTTNTLSLNSQTPDGVFVTAKAVPDKIVFTYHNRNTTPVTFNVETHVTIFKTEHA